MSRILTNTDNNIYKSSLKFQRNYSPFNMCLIRNKEMNNLLSSTAGTQLYITAKSGLVLTVPNLPNYHEFDSGQWAAIITTVAKWLGGDYNNRYFCSIDRFKKTLTFAAGTDLTNWEVGDSIAVYNPFVNYEFVGDQTTTPIWDVDGGAPWRSGTSHGGGIWIGADGVYRWLVNGTSGITQIGYAKATSMDGVWTIQNGDNPVVTAANLADCTGTIYSAGSVITLADGRNAVFVIYAANTGFASIRIMLFDDDFNTITFTDKIFDPGYHLSGGGLEYFGGYFHILYYHRPGAVAGWELRAAKCATIDGTFTDYQTNILTGAGAVDTAHWKDHIDAPAIWKTKNKVYGVVGGTGGSALSGNYGNRLYCLLDFNYKTQTWSPDRRGPIFMNPLYWTYMGGDYAWAWDHCGGYPNLFRDTDGQYYCSMSMNAGSGTYQGTLIKLKLKD